MEALAKQVIAQGGGGSFELIPYEQVYSGGGFEDLQRRVPCTDKIKGLLNWQAQLGLSDIIAESLAATKEAI